MLTGIAALRIEAYPDTALGGVMRLMKKVVGTKGPFPYSPGILAGNFLFVSGQVGIDPRTLEVPEEIEEQTKNCLERVKNVVEQAGGTMKHVVRTTVYLSNPKDFLRMNEAYAEFFPEEPPARTTIIAKTPAPEYLIEIDAVALIE